MMISASSPNLITQAVESPPSYATIYNNNIPAAAINDTRHMSMPNIVDAQRAANNNGLGFANPAPYPRTAPCPQPCPYPEPKQTSQIPVPSSILPNSFPLLQQPMQQYAPQSVQQPIQVQPVQMQPVQVQPVQVQPVQVQPVQVQPVQMQPPQAPMQITIQNKADNTNKNANIIAGRRYCPRCDAVLIRQLNPYIVATIVVIGLLLSPFGWLLFFILCTQAARSWKCPVCHYGMC